MITYYTKMETKPTVFLSSESDQLCSQCNKYLSVGPVAILSDKPLCGRCPNPKAVRIGFYHWLAHRVYFPCTNDRYGCDTMLAWGSVRAHEEICKYIPVVCPALECVQELRNDGIIEHFEIDHKELVASNREFKVPCGNEEENSLITKLISWNNQPFILKVNYSLSSCFCSVSSWGISDGGEMKYNLLIEDEDKQQSLQIKNVAIAKYGMKHHDNTTMTKLDVDTLKHALNAKTIVCTISIGQECRNINSVNESLLLDVECPICMHYMKPSMFMCKAGHSICSSCKSNISKCPTCRIPLKNNRNVALEKIIEHIIFPCRNRSTGCCFTGTLSRKRLFTWREDYNKMLCEPRQKMHLEWTAFRYDVAFDSKASNQLYRYHLFSCF